MKIVWASILAIVLAVSAWCGRAQLINESRYGEVAKDSSGYNGNWWASVDRDEHSGFYDGSDDCLTSDAHVGSKFFGTSLDSDFDAFDLEVTKYYREHPDEKLLPVIEVSRRVGRQIGKDTPQTPGGEKWTNPHWYLNGDWYQHESEAERFGYLEGYIGCLRTYVKNDSARYSQPIHYYDDKIWDYIDAAKTNDEAVADILRRFRDRADSGSAGKQAGQVH